MDWRFLIVWIVTAIAINGDDTPSWLDSNLPPNERIVEDRFFEPDHTYTFVYDAQIATGIPGASKQHSGTRIQCLVELIFASQTSCTLQLSAIRFGRLNRELPNPRQVVPFEAFEQVPLHPDVKRTLEMPVGFTYKDGVVNDVTFDGEESPWSSNVIRGVLNMIQINLNPERQIPTEARRLVNVINPNDPLLKAQAKKYRVQEKTLEGDCETIYTVFNTPTDDEVDKLIVYKTVDFDKCIKRPEVKYNFRFADPCTFCRDSRGKPSNEFFKTSTLAKYEVRYESHPQAGRSGSWLLENVKYESEHIFSPYDPRAGVAVSYLNQTLVLLKSSNSTSTQRHMSSPIKSDWGLIYALDWDIWKERFAMDGDEDRQLHYLRRMPYSDVKREKRSIVVALVRAVLVRSPAGALDEEAPGHLMKLVQAFRLFTKSELDDVFRELTSHDEGPWTDKQRKIIKDLLPHVGAMCGTKECLAHLVEKIQNGEIDAMKAAQSLKSVLGDRTISAKEIEELLRLTESDVVAQSFPLRQSLWLTIGSLMNGLCMPNEDVLAREYRDDVSTFCTRQLKENYIETLFNKFQTSEKYMDQILYMKTIGNAGLDLSVFSLERIIRRADELKEYSDAMRTEAILALRQLKNVMPRKMQKILLPIVCNLNESPNVRIAAAYQLLHTMPERAVLDQIARMLYTEPSKQVASFIYTYMHTLVKSTNPCEQRLVADLKLALRHARVDYKLEDSAGYSSMKYYDVYNRLYHSGVEMEMSTLFSNQSFLPKYWSATLHTNAMGFWHKYLFTLGVAQDGLEQMVGRWALGKNTSRTGPLVDELKGLFAKLGMKSRAPSDENAVDPKLFAYLKFLDQDYAIIPFKLGDDTEDVEGSLDLMKLIRDLKTGIKINVNEADLLAEISYKIPTILGLPLLWTIRMPVLYSITGTVKLSNVDGDWKRMKVVADLKPSFVATMLTEMEAHSPVVNSGLRIISRAKLHAPLKGQFELDLRSDPITSKFSLKLPTGKKELLSLETRPITITRIWPERPLETWNEPDTVSIISDDNPSVKQIQFKQCFGRNTLGVEICARGQYARPSDLVKQAPRCPLIGPEKILITSESIGGRTTPAEISFKMSLKLDEKSAQPIRATFAEWKESPSSPMATSTDASADPQQQQSSKPSATYTVSNPRKHTLNFDLQANENSLFKARFVHTRDPHRLYSSIDWMFRAPAAAPGAVCLKGEWLFPEPPYSVDEMPEIDRKKVMASVNLGWTAGDQCPSGDAGGMNMVQVQMQAYQPRTHYDVHRKDQDHIIFERCLDNQRYGNCSPIMQYEHLVHSSRLTKYRFAIQHKNVPPFLANYTLNLYERLKHVLHSHSDVDSIGIGNPREKISVDLELNARDMHRGDLTIKTPNENVCFLDIPIPTFLSALNLKHDRIKSLADYFGGRVNRAFCHISRRKIRTFDGVEYAIPLSTCYHVLAADCSSDQPSFTVLTRRMDEENFKMELKVITPTHKVVMTPKSDGESLEIDINGQKYAVGEEIQEVRNDEGRLAIRINPMGPYVKVELPLIRISIFFDGYAVNIKISQLYTGVQCGLCGHYNNEPMDEFRTPNSELEQDVRQFFFSWIVSNSPSGCRAPEAKSVCTDGKCPYRPFSEDAHRMKDPERLELQEEPMKKTKIIELDSQVCFSTQPIAQCRLRTYPIRKETRQIQFACYERDEEQVDSMLQKLQVDDTIPIDRPASGVRNLDIPSKCAPL